MTRTGDPAVSAKVRAARSMSSSMTITLANPTDMRPICTPFVSGGSGGRGRTRGLERSCVSPAAGPERVPRALHLSNACTRLRRYFPVPLPLRTALLAAAATAATALAVVRITSAAEHRTLAGESAAPERSATPAQAAATLAKLHAPPGFREGRELPLSGLRRRRKVLLDSPRTRSRRSDARADLGDLASASRRRTPSRFLLRPSQPQRRNSDRPLQLGARTWPELVAVFADSVLVPAGSTRTPTAAKVLRYWRRGTEINLAVIGHWSHDKAPASALRL
jgi:hypothetical protein